MQYQGLEQGFNTLVHMPSSYPAMYLYPQIVIMQKYTIALVLFCLCLFASSVTISTGQPTGVGQVTFFDDKAFKGKLHAGLAPTMILQAFKYHTCIGHHIYQYACPPLTRN